MKPGAILSELEREPVIFWGCTRSEIFSALRRGMMIGVVTASLLTVTAAAFLRSSTLVPIWMLSMMGTTYLLTRGRLRRIASLRAGRPLFYELHALIYKKPQFIQPATRYQRERNLSDPLAVAARTGKQRQQRCTRRDLQDSEDAPGKAQGLIFPWQRREAPLADAAETAGADAGDRTLPDTAAAGPPSAADADPNPESPARAEPRLTLNKTDDQE